VSGADNKEFVEITEDELKQVTGGAKLPAMHKAPDVTLKRG
jgi:bacteriocin-like protein